MQRSLEQMEILLVEDNPSHVDLTKYALEETAVPSKLTVMENGVDALNYLRHHADHPHAVCPDLIILDLNLPKKNGHEVLAEIKNDSELRRIPVMVFTSSDSEKDILKAYDQHANCYVTKQGGLKRFVEVANTIKDFWFGIASLSG